MNCVKLSQPRTQAISLMLGATATSQKDPGHEDRVEPLPFTSIRNQCRNQFNKSSQAGA
jgi:hypothetical protein